MTAPLRMQIEQLQLQPLTIVSLRKRNRTAPQWQLPLYTLISDTPPRNPDNQRTEYHPRRARAIVRYSATATVMHRRRRRWRLEHAQRRRRLYQTITII